jgi:hypothetical protein
MSLLFRSFDLQTCVFWIANMRDPASRRYVLSLMSELIEYACFYISCFAWKFGHVRTALTNAACVCYLVWLEKTLWAMPLVEIDQ